MTAPDEPPCPGSCGACLPGGVCCGDGAADLVFWLRLPEVVVRAVLRLLRSPPSGAATALALGLIVQYQQVISRRTAAHCRYVPTCSAYAASAVRRHGLGAGLRMVVARLARCRASIDAGTPDPVPARL